MFEFSPKSDYIEQVKYNSDTGQLTVYFKRGKKTVYNYSQVPVEVFAQLKVASSAGQFFRENIRDKYKGSQSWQPSPKKNQLKKNQLKKN